MSGPVCPRTKSRSFPSQTVFMHRRGSVATWLASMTDTSGPDGGKMEVIRDCGAVSIRFLTKNYGEHTRDDGSALSLLREAGSANNSSHGERPRLNLLRLMKS